MKYTGYIDINKPIQEVVDFFAKSDNQKKWQDGFIKKEQLKGNGREAGAAIKLYYKFGKRDMILTESVISNNLPNSFESSYHHTHMDNTMKCSFVPLSEEKTRYQYEFEYTRISWIMPKLMAILFPGMYRKQGEKWIRQFKEVIEKQ
ncbi:MAG: SRPBCC family protein [Maribacter sp.]|uniref:SRPBCC family protein n=1 Tax=Maribacter sp. TaxID=1897614 RepID=UPI003296DF70